MPLRSAANTARHTREVGPLPSRPGAASPKVSTLRFSRPPGVQLREPVRHLQFKRDLANSSNTSSAYGEPDQLCQPRRNRIALRCLAAPLLAASRKTGPVRLPMTWGTNYCTYICSNLSLASRKNPPT